MYSFWASIYMGAYAIRLITKASGGSYLTRHEEGTMQFRTPIYARRCTLVTSGACLIFLLVFLIFTEPSVAGYLTLFCVLCFFGTGFVYLLRLSGPQDIRLDGSQRTYERTTGWPWKPTTQIGPFEDIKGVCVSPFSRTFLLTTKRTFGYKGIPLSSPYTSESQALAEDVSREFGFQIVPYPK